MLPLEAMAAGVWPATYRGYGLRIEMVPDGRFVGLVAGGYRTAPQLTAGEALAAVTAWCDAQPLRGAVAGAR